MRNRNMIHSRLTFAIAMALVALVSTTGNAKNDHDDSGHGDDVAVGAAACTELPDPLGAPSARSGGGFTVRDGATASLICPLPTDELDSSSGDRPKAITLQIAYLDSDGPGGAVVGVELVRTVLAADPDGFTDEVACAWSSAGGGAVVGTRASVVCDAGIVEGGFYHLRVGLSSAPGGAASFIGAVAGR